MTLSVKSSFDSSSSQATTDLSEWLIVVPARLQSTRLKEKPLQDLCGKPLIVRVADNLHPLKAMGATIVVATDSQTVYDACVKHALSVEMTAVTHPSGSDRANEVASRHAKKYVLNVQGDEPFVSIQDLVTLMGAIQSSKTPMGTLVYKDQSLEHFLNPSIVKVVVSSARDAIYFSRAPVPYPRDEMLSIKPTAVPEFWRHIGVYGFEKESLAKFCQMPEGRLEKLERLEQLRAIENGWRISVTQASSIGIGVDTPEDLEAARSHFLKISRA